MAPHAAISVCSILFNAVLTYSVEEDAAVSLLQNVISYTRRSPVDTPSLDDAMSLAQGTVERPASEVEATGEGLREAKASEPEKPAQPQDSEPDDEDGSCSLEGLTPGVCAMESLARKQSTSEQAADLDYLRPERLERALFSEIEAALMGKHAGFGAARLAELRQELSGLFAALPKNEAGRLEPAAVRYALHQHFLRQHAWYVRSLNPAGEAQTPASPGEALRGRVPEHLQRLLEQRLGFRGLSEDELSVLVATLEHLIEGDMHQRLKAAYRAEGLSHNSPIEREEMARVLSTFMAHFLSTQHRSGYAMTPDEALQERIEIAVGYSGWSDVIRMVDGSVGRAVPPRVSFSDVLSGAKEVMGGYARKSADECRDIKRELAGMPGGDTGRVPLSDLHRKAVDGEMLFAESTQYLASLGALDYSKPGSPAVLVPNYVYSPSNCLGTTSFLDLCCPNECETLLQDLERSVKAPSATPASIGAVLAQRHALAPTKLSALEDVAQASGGRLALHGLAFSQWLNLAFPLECPRPRVEDFTNGTRSKSEVPDGAREFMAVADMPLAASRAELREELSEGFAPVALTQNSSIGNQDDVLKAAAVKALSASGSRTSTGLKILAGLDASSFAQEFVQAAAPVDEEEPASAAQPSKGSTLRVRRMQ